MRSRVDRARLDAALTAFARAADGPTHVYLVGGATAVAIGWRTSTIDIDFVMRPEDDALMRALPSLKEGLDINLEMASPLDFIPVPDGWEARSPHIRRIDHVDFHHFDPYAQALAKLERGHAQDTADVQALVGHGLVRLEPLREYFTSIVPALYRFPAVDAATFARAVHGFLEKATEDGFH